MIPSGLGHPRRLHYRGAGPRPGAGRWAGAPLFPALPEASLALRWEPSPRASRSQQRCGEERGEGLRRTDRGGGTQGQRDTEPSPCPARSGRRPHAAHLTHRTGFRWEWARTELGRKSLLPPGRSGAEDLPCRTAPGLEEPVAPREPAAPGKCAAPPHHPCRRPVQAPGREGLPEGSQEGWGLHCAPARRTHADGSPEQSTEKGRAGFRCGSTLGTGSSSGNFN